MQIPDLPTKPPRKPLKRGIARRLSRLSTTCLASLATAFALTSCDRSAPQVEFKRCSDGRGLQRCTEISVPLVAADPSQGELSVRVRVVGAGHDRNKDKAPLFMLAGGPGQSAYELASYVVPSLRHMAKDRDLVFVEQRGTGEKSALHCDEDEARAVHLSDLLAISDEEVKRTRHCADTLVGDPANFTTPAFIADLEQIRQKLGYEKIALYGVSYGTRAALAYLEQHAEHVELAVLDAAAPAELSLLVDPVLDAQPAIDRWIAACEATPNCQATYPELRTHFDKLLAGLESAPPQVELDNPWTSVPENSAVATAQLAGFLRMASYSRSTAWRIPFVVESAASGNWAPLAGLGASGGDGSMSAELLLSILCQEDIASASPEKIKQAEATPMGKVMVAMQLEVCGFWKKGPSQKPAHGKFVVDTPVLVLSGELDPVTPPPWGEIAASYSTASRHVIYPGNGHGAHSHPCSADLVGGFLNDPSTWQLQESDKACLKKAATHHFYTSALGPTVTPLAKTSAQTPATGGKK